MSFLILPAGKYPFDRFPLRIATRGKQDSCLLSIRREFIREDLLAGFGKFKYRIIPLITC